MFPDSAANHHLGSIMQWMKTLLIIPHIKLLPKVTRSVFQLRALDVLLKVPNNTSPW